MGKMFKTPKAPAPPKTVETKDMSETQDDADARVERRRKRQYGMDKTVMRRGGDLYSTGGRETLN